MWAGNHSLLGATATIKRQRLKEPSPRLRNTRSCGGRPQNPFKLYDFSLVTLMALLY